MKDKTITEAAHAVSAKSGRRCSEGALRRLDARKIVHPARDPWDRRLFGDDDIEAASEYLMARSDAATAD